MLMHTKGILVMTPDSAMVLTGKQSLDFSGGVSAEDNFGIGGYDRVMGPNGQAQYWAPDLAGACEVLMSALRPHLRRAGGVRVRGGRRPPTRWTATSASYPHELADSDFRTVGDIFSAGHQPRPQEAVRHPHGHARRRRPGPPGAGALGRDGRRRHHGRPGRPPRRLPGLPARASSRGRCRGGASRPATARTRGRRARCSRGRRRRRRGRSTPPAATGRWSCWRTCPASTAHRTRCATCSWSTAPRSAGRSSTSTGPIVFCVDLALPRRRVRGVLQDAQPADDRAGGRGVVRLGDRRCAGRRRGLRRRGQQADRRATRGCWSWRRGWPRPGAPSGPSSAPSWPSCARRCGRRSSAEVATEFDARAQHPAGGRGRLGGRGHRRQRAATPPGRWHRGWPLESAYRTRAVVTRAVRQIVEEDGTDHASGAGRLSLSARTGPAMTNERQNVSTNAPSSERHHVVVIGSGFGGSSPPRP